MAPTKEVLNVPMAAVRLTRVLASFRLHVLWGLLVVATSVTKVAKRKVSHQLITMVEFMRMHGCWKGQR